jgi:ABC-type sugar transport system ATPase subunit
LIRELAADGAAVLVSSADIEEVTLLSDRIVVLGSGLVAGVLEGPDISIGEVRHVALA